MHIVCFVARDAAGQEVHTWTAMPGRSVLGPGKKLEFRSRLISPPDHAVDVMVRFINASERNAGGKVSARWQTVSTDLAQKSFSRRSM